MVVAVALQILAVLVAITAGFLLAGVGGALVPVAAAGWILGGQLERRAG